jgi:PTH1 family peptidyl-tRNA hydrolase
VKAIVGLGNPGRRYEGTRHNVGFAVVDELARRASAAFESSPAEALLARWRYGPDAESVLLIKPLTFMNASGQAVGALARYYKVSLDELLVVVDEVQLPLGRLRIRPSGSAGGHNGLKSIIQHIGAGFPRLRIGVGRGDPDWDLADHVLSTFAADERDVAAEAVTRAADAAEAFLAHGVGRAMNLYNAGGDGGAPRGRKDSTPDPAAKRDGKPQRDHKDKTHATNGLDRDQAPAGPEPDPGPRVRKDRLN